MVDYAPDMSADDKDATCACEKLENLDKFDEESLDTRDSCDDVVCAQKRSKPTRRVSFPDDDHIVTQYFEPANPWQDGKCSKLLAIIQNSFVSFYCLCSY